MSAGRALVLQGNALQLPLADESVDLVCASNSGSDLVKYSHVMAPAVRQHPGAWPTPSGRCRHGAWYFVSRPLLDPLTNWWSKVDKRGPDDCWPWKAGRDKDGYGKFAIGLGGKKQRHVRAHRFGYEALVGPIPPGHVVCHSCDNPPCQNPTHWFTGTPLDNNDDKVRKNRHAKLWGVPLIKSRQTHCKRGHEFTPENTRIVNGFRTCKECSRINAREWYAKHGPAPRPVIRCAECGNQRPHRAHGRCATCDQRWRRKGGEGRR
jgi:hypothetical protein